MARLLSSVRERVTGAAAGPFRHADYPLADTLDHRGDPGLFGPDSATWLIMADVATFIGGIRALLIQAAHPEVAAGVFDHSEYRDDPLGRLSRTSSYVTVTAYGSMPEVADAVAIVRRAHRPVRGSSHRGRPYSAGRSDLAAWVHNALTDSFLVCSQVFGRVPIDQQTADRFVDEQTRVGALLDADPMPDTAAELATWVRDHPDLAASPGLQGAVDFLRDPRLPPALRIGYRIMFWAASATIPDRLRKLLGIRRYPGAIALGRALIGGLRWAMGSSPSWKLALIRVGAHIPEELFTQDVPIGESGRWAAERDGDQPTR